MEVEGDEIDGYEGGGARGGGFGEEDGHFFQCEVLEWEYAVCCGCEDGEGLLEGEEGEEDEGEGEERDDKRAVPGVGGAAEGDGRDAADEDAGYENGSDPIYFCQAGEKAFAWLGILAWEKEDVNGAE